MAKELHPPAASMDAGTARVFCTVSDARGSRVMPAVAGIQCLHDDERMQVDADPRVRGNDAFQPHARMHVDADSRRTNLARLQ